jgi:hypothetical protein
MAPLALAWEQDLGKPQRAPRITDPRRLDRDAAGAFLLDGPVDPYGVHARPQHRHQPIDDLLFALSQCVICRGYADQSAACIDDISGARSTEWLGQFTHLRKRRLEAAFERPDFDGVATQHRRTAGRQ